jgi:hypothetical protein
MYPTTSGKCLNGELSANEQFHSALAYSRTPGNLDPDSEPNTMLYDMTSQALPPRVVICPARR